MKKNALYPVFLKVEHLEVLIVGGGNTGLEKISGLLKSSPGAKITLIGETVLEAITELTAHHPQVIIHKRLFQPEDLEGKELLILATDNRDLHQEIRLLAKKKNLLVNVADTPDLCDFYLGGVVSKGNLKLGISTNGESPTMAKRLREFFESVLPENMDDLLANMNQIRNNVKGDLQKKIEVLNQVTKSWKNKDE
jgi:precorrin-2 dehydrogenase/sirohydrochlorin ferrochelatase